MNAYDQEKDYTAFKNALPKLLESHSGHFVVFHNAVHVKVFKELEAAVRFGMEKYGSEQFIAQKIEDCSEPSVLSYTLAI